MRFEVELSLSFVTLYVIFIGSYRDSKKIRQWIPVEKVYPTCWNLIDIRIIGKNFNVISEILAEHAAFKEKRELFKSVWNTS